MANLVSDNGLASQLQSGSFSQEDWVQIRQGQRLQINGLEVPAPVPLNLSEVEGRKLDYAVGGLRRIYGNHCGILASSYQREHFPADPQWFEFHMNPCDTRYLCYDTQSFGRRSGNASALTRHDAMMMAAGEVIERYSSGIFTRDNLVRASYNELAADGIPATPPEDYAYYNREQFESEVRSTHPNALFFDRETPGWWQWGQSLVTGQQIMVPSIFCYLPFYLRGRPGDETTFWDSQISTGLAAHGTLEMALLRGLYEVVERDAIMLTWHNRLPTTGLHLENATDPELLAVLANIPFSRKNCFVTNISLDIGLTTCFGVYLCDDGNKPYSVVAAACGLSPQKVAARCLKELILGYTGMTEYTLKPPASAHEKALLSGDFSKCNTLDQHFTLFAGYDLRPEMAFISNQPARWANIGDLPDLSTGSVLGDLERAVEAVKACGLDVIGLDLTTEDVATVGFKVARVLVPGAQPLDPDHRIRHLGSKRLREIKRRLGLAGRDMTEADYNPVPHPFP
jgi:ribosomal protein S12 methylthiotransferase accessory factor